MKKKDLKDKLKTLSGDEVFTWIARIFFFASASVIIVFLMYFMKFPGSFSNKQGDWADFGSFVGGTLSPILSFLGLIALLVTIILQSKELEATRKELERSATAQENSEKSFLKQSEILNRQQFESTFFSLLEQHNNSLHKLSVESSLNKNISDLYLIVRYVLINDAADLSGAKKRLDDKSLLCGHYFRILYQTLKFIATSVPGSEIGLDFKSEDIINKPVTSIEKMYSNIIRSFLNNELTQLLAINCYCSNEDDTYWKYKLLVERYEFLEHMPFKNRLGHEQLLFIELSDYYTKAFGKSSSKPLAEGSRV